MKLLSLSLSVFSLSLSLSLCVCVCVCVCVLSVSPCVSLSLCPLISPPSALGVPYRTLYYGTLTFSQTPLEIQHGIWWTSGY
jgi:hypothetical protein